MVDNFPSITESSNVLDKINTNPFLQNSLEAFPWIAAIYDQNYNIIYLNKKGCDFAGFSKEELGKKNVIIS